jgi:signal transduction histidine kinase
MKPQFSEQDKQGNIKGMEEQSRSTRANFMEAIGERKIQRFYPWILIGLVFFYLTTFRWLTPMVMAIPVLVAGWFYYRRGAVIASLLALVTNAVILTMGWYDIKMGGTYGFSIPFLVGHLSIILISITIGFFREELEKHHQIDKKVQLREQHLFLIHMATKEILGGDNLNDTYFRLLQHLTNLVKADHACLTVWDEGLQTLSLAATTYRTEQPYTMIPLQKEELSHTVSILTTRHILFLDDIRQHPQLTNLYSLNALNELIQSAILIPLATSDFRFGIVVLGFASSQTFHPDEMSYIELSSQQITLALRSARQEHRIENQLRVDQALIRIGQALSASERTGTGEVLQLIVDSARELMPHAEKSVIHLLDEEGQTLFAHAVSGFDDHEKKFQRVGMRLGEGIAGQVINEGITINIEDILNHPSFLPTKSTPNYRSLLVAPVQSGSYHIGTISIQSSLPHAFSNNDAEVLKALAIQAAVALENTRLFETTQQSLKEVNILYQFSRALALSLDADQLFKDMIELLEQIFDYYYAQIYLIDPDTQNLILKIGSGPVGRELVKKGYYLPAGDGIVGHVAATGEPFVTNNVEDVVFFKGSPLLAETHSEIAVPIKDDQRVIGILDIQQTRARRFSDDDLHLMIAIADQLALVLQKANLYSTLQTALQQEKMVRSQLIQSERLALVGRLLASVSHELNNPLQAIQNALFLLKDEKNLSSQAQQDLDVILSEAERMAALIERLRSAYRPIRIKDFQPVELNDLIEDVHTLISTHMRHKKIAFEFLPDPQLLQVSGLPDQLRQVVLNLFLNAIEIMQPGGRLVVSTRSLPLENEVLLTVKDSGPGIDDEIMPYIFDAFITSKHTGTGLGLTITHDIIQQHHGRITGGNDPEGGAVFNVWLPMYGRGDE